MIDLSITDKKAAVDKIVKFINDSVLDYKREGVVIGISGGIDCTLSAFFAREALGRERITMFSLYERDTPGKSKMYIDIAEEFLNIPVKRINATVPLMFLGLYKLEPFSGYFVPEKVKRFYTLQWLEKISKNDPAVFKNFSNEDPTFRHHTTYYFLKARFITLISYKFADLENKFVIDTINKTELMTGYHVPYGESGDIMPLSPFFKTQVRDLAKFVGIPDRIVNRPPAPGIVPFINDEQALGLSYELLDKILFCLEKGVEDETISRELSIELGLVARYKKIRDIALKVEKLPLRLEI